MEQNASTFSAEPTISQVGDEPLVSVVIPCLNEAGNIEECVTAAWNALDANGITGEVVVADNGSTDGSAELARAAGARVVHEPRKGYGSAYLAGFAAARGDYIVMADADLTYDFSDIPRALGVPYTYWGIGGIDADTYREAESAGRVAQDIPVNHSATFAPAVQPTLDTGVETLVVAATAWLAR